MAAHSESYNQKKQLIVLATGGTGGHVFPAEALAQELGARGYRLALVTDRRGVAYGGALDRLDRYTISASAISGRGLIGKVKAALKLARGYGQARGLLKRLRPAAAIGFGGYPSAPVMLAASRIGAVRTAIHEQNAVLGRANRLLAPRVDAIATSFERTREIREADAGKVERTGNPIRPAIKALATEPYPEPEPDGAIAVLITGGSQGAQVFGDLIPGALAELSQDQRARLSITQQVRAEQVSDVDGRYKFLGVRSEIKPFFDDMPARLRAAHLVIGRAGASTLAELTTAGRPAILIPYPYAIDDHQSENAARLSDAAGAWTIPQADATPSLLAARLAELIDRPAVLTAAAQAAHRIGAPDAAERLAELVVRLIGDSDRGVEENALAPDGAETAA